MFTEQDLAVFDLPDSWEKVDALGETYFPQLGALLVKATHLIAEIYGIDVFSDHRTSQAPTPTKQRRKGIALNTERNPLMQVTMGLRGRPKIRKA